MSIKTLTLNSDQLDSLSEGTLFSLIDMSDLTPDASYSAQWIEPSEGKTWDLPCYLVEIGTRVVMWSDTDESGIEDVTWADAEQDLDEQVRSFAENIALGLGMDAQS